MNRHDVKALQSIRHYPCVSLLAPTHRRAPENRQDPIRVRNLVDEAIARVRQEQSARESAALEKNLLAVVDGIDWNRTLDGIAIFANEHIARAFTLPFSVAERTVVDETFATRDLVRALNRVQRYWVLALSEKPTRLYEADENGLTEVQAEGFPMTHTGPGGEEPLPAGRGVNKSAIRDERHRQFFRTVDDALGRVLNVDPLPVVLAGVDRYHAFYRELSRNQDRIVATLTGSHDSTTPAELHRLVQPLIEDWNSRQRHDSIAELRAAVGQRRAADTIDDIWRAAQEGRVRRLFLEQDFAVAARISDDNLSITLTDDRDAPDVVDDIIDELVEQVVLTGGDVTFVDNGALADFQRMGAMLRY